MHRRRQHGSSGELDVFRATRYFAGHATARPIAAVVVREAEDMIIQVKTTSSDDWKTDEAGHHAQLAPGVGKNNRSKLAAFLGSLVSPEATSFRKKSPPAESSGVTTPTYIDDPPKLAPSSSSASSGRTSIDVVAAAAAAASVHGGGGRHDDDLGVAMWEDRRLQGVRVVRCGGCDEERWVVRCGAWEEQHHHHHGDEKNAILAAATATRYGSQVQGDQEVIRDGSHWESDSSSDLFELDLEST